MVKYLVKSIGNKKWLWFKKTNNYLQLEAAVFSVFEQLQNNKSLEEVIKWCAQEYRLPLKEARKTVYEIHKLTEGQMKSFDQPKDQAINFNLSDSFFSSKTYRFNTVLFQLFYGDAHLETMIHPLFAHLETQQADINRQSIKLYFQQETYILEVNGKQIGNWTKQEDHIFKGQVFMAMLNAAYNKKEKDWLGVLHASAVGNNENSILFLGDSGNGKSTASAIALASGLSLIADDFVPIDTRGRVLAFPAAISVKKQALEFLSKRFPELLKAKEYELKAMNKTVRYLAPKALGSSLTRNVKALIFITFTKEVDFELKPLDKQIAFQHLVLDSWLSPEEENARFFMDWIAELPAYQLRYSNNDKMLDTLKKLLANDE
jgi:hypothetical protein